MTRHELTASGPCGISFDLGMPQQGADNAMPQQTSRHMQDDVYRLFATRLFPGGGKAPLSNKVVDVSHGEIIAISDAGKINPSHIHSRHDIVAPGFIDLQINGAGGVLFNDTPDVGAIRQMGAAARRGGTCHFLPTFITARRDSYRRAMAAVSEYDGPEILGLHLEGPFLSAARPGIHPPNEIRKITAADIDALCGFEGRLLLTVAPEEVGTEDLSTLRKAGVILFAGHTNSDSEAIEKAYENGLVGITHLYNACSQMTARSPGVVGTALRHDSLFAGIIADGIHVHAGALALAAKCMEGRLFLVSDAMPSYGSDTSGFTLGGQQIDLVGTRLQSSDGTLAGAHLGLDEAVRNMVTLADVGLSQALHMASGIPATVLGLEASYGLIAAGRAASLTCLEDDLTAEAVMVHGQFYPV